jgi:RNA polymerase sigma factor (sigma-70 family)
MIQYCVRNFRNINVEDAEDFVQDALLKLIEIVTKREVRKKDAPAIRWMKKELKWRCIDLVRKKEREEGKVINDEDGENIIDTLPNRISIEDEIIRREIYQFLRKCIQTRMKGRRREIFELCLEGYTDAEIARKLGVSPAFVSKEKKIGHRLLRKWLTERGFDWDSIKVYFP